MLNFFKKTNDNKIYAPIKGKCIDISNVNDEVFSKKMMGDGVAIIPTDNIVHSPCEGEIVMVFPTKHAFGITMNNGVEVLIHIGMDTVNLNGLGFKAFKNKGDKVKHGDKIIEFDSNYLSNKDLDMTVMVIITNNNDHKFDKLGIDKEVSKEDKILVLEDTE
jgi:sugar PTS system EIIA component